MVSVGTLQGTAIVEAIKQSGIEFVVALPDITTSQGVLLPIAQDPNLRLIRVSKEDEGVSICAGLSLCNKRAVLLMQNTGLLDSINSVRGTAVEFEMPVCMIVGLLGKEPDVAPMESDRYGVRITEPILDAMGVEHHLIEQAQDVAKIGPAIDNAYATSSPVVLLIGRRLEQP